MSGGGEGNASFLLPYLIKCLSVEINFKTLPSSPYFMRFNIKFNINFMIKKRIKRKFFYLKNVKLRLERLSIEGNLKVFLCFMRFNSKFIFNIKFMIKWTF
jgi:hypothetical protein